MNSLTQFGRDRRSGAILSTLLCVEGDTLALGGGGGGMHVAVHYVHFVKYDDAVSFYDAVSDTIRRRGGNRGIFTEEGVDTVAYFGGNHGSRV